MVSALELSSRALLCRRFAEQEPANRVLWITEAERWEQLSQRETSHRKTLSFVFAGPVRQRLVMLRVAGHARKTG
jgi:hypothetical protein